MHSRSGARRTPTAAPPAPGGPFRAPERPARRRRVRRSSQTPLAKIDDVTITLGEFEERLNRQSPYIRARYTSLEQKKEFLD